MEALEQARVETLLLAEDFDAPELDDAVEKAITQSARILVVRHHDDLIPHAGSAPSCASRRRRYVTRSRRGLGLQLPPHLRHGRPSTTTTSAVKSFAPRSSEEPTP